MKKILILFSAVLLMILSGCDDSFLDTKNLYEKSLDNFYQSPTDIEEAMSGVYNALYMPGVHSDEHIAASLMSDLMLGGGGPDDNSAKNVDKFQDPEEDTYNDLWIQTYNGISRVNGIIEAVPDADYSSFFDSEAQANEFKNQALGEAYFMRGFLMFRAAKFFGGMPLILATDADRTVPRSSFSETFAQIISDLKIAIETLPDKTAQEYDISQYGHANKWVAQAYMARVYLFYTGYMTNMMDQATSDVTLPGDAGTVSKSDVVGYLNDCIEKSGYSLTPDFRNLWPYSHVNESAGSAVLPWADAEGLAWAGQDGPMSSIGTGNNEVMFALRYAFGDWGYGQQFNNRSPLFFGIRGNFMVPFGEGWGWGTVHPLLYNQWDDADMRKKGSVLEMGDDDQGTGGYQADKGDHETGFFNKKYTTVQHDGSDGVAGMFYYLYGISNNDKQLWAAQDFYYMRFADVLLMHSELTEDASSMNAVRARAGLDPIAYSLDALKEERKHELAFEGLRWFDLVRWGDVEDNSKNFYDNEVDVTNSGIPAKYSITYPIETKGLVPIPEYQLRLSDGAYEQNPGW